MCFVEGKDIKTLSRIQNLIHPQNQLSLDQLPTVELGGWSRFNEALGAARLFFEETNGEIQTFCILDHDYHTDNEIKQLYQRAEENNLILHVWQRKELENYIFSPASIFRVTNAPSDEFDTFQAELLNELDSLKPQTLGCILDHLHQNDRSKTPSYFLEQAQQILNEKWGTLEGRMCLANGKDVLTLVNSWVRRRYGKSCSRAKLLKELDISDVAEEMRTLIDTLLQ